MEMMQVVIPCALRRGGYVTSEIVQTLKGRYKPERPAKREDLAPLHAKVFLRKGKQWYDIIFTIPRDEVEAFKKVSQTFLRDCLEKRYIALHKRIQVRKEPPKGAPSFDPNAA